MTRALRTRSLLAALLVLGQLAALWHGLEHAGRHDRTGGALADERAHHHGRVHPGAHPLAHHHALDARPAPESGGEHESASCGLCLLSAAGAALVDTPFAARSADAREVVSGVRDAAPPERHVRARSARDPPPLVS